MLSKKARKRICKHYGVKRLKDIVDREQKQLESDLLDAFCLKCGGLYPEKVSPDATDYYCEHCDNDAVDSLFMILMAEV